MKNGFLIFRGENQEIYQENENKLKGVCERKIRDAILTGKLKWAREKSK